MAGVVWRETELGSESLGKNRICSSENQEIGHRLRERWLGSGAFSLFDLYRA